MGFAAQSALFLALATLSSSSIISSPTKEGIFELLILHNNDMHARFEQTSQLSGVCSIADRDAGKCYGGFPRVATIVKEARRAAASGEGPPVLYLNAGDTYTGTVWFTIYKWKIAAEFINALQPDAIALGNNEFTAGSNEPSHFINSLKTPILSSNVIPNLTPSGLQKSVVFDINGVKVGLVGYLGLDTQILDNTASLEYIDEVVALKEEIANLRASNVSIIIALGHTDPSKELEIAQEVEGIDLVLSGHKNVFFWNGTNAEDKSPKSESIHVVTQASGKQVPIIHSYAYNKYLGSLKLKFDKDVGISEYNANAILLDESVSQDIEAVEIMKTYSHELAKYATEVLGETAVVLDGQSCKSEECNLGNFVADAMVYNHALTYNNSDQPWTDAPIGILHGGAFASSIAPSDRPAAVTRGDLLSALPIEGNLVTVAMNGTVFIQLLEHSAAEDEISDGFLQFSGVRVVYDYEKEPGSRVVSAVARCGTCWVPEFYTIEDFRTYTAIMPAALLDERYGYSMLQGLASQNLPYDLVTSTAAYIQMRSPIYPEVANRISIRNRPELLEDNSDNSDNSAVTLTSSITIICFTIISFII